MKASPAKTSKARPLGWAGNRKAVFYGIQRQKQSHSCYTEELFLHPGAVLSKTEAWRY